MTNEQHHRRQPRHNKTGKNYRRKVNSKPKPPNVASEEKVVADQNAMANEGVPGFDKPHAKTQTKRAPRRTGQNASTSGAHAAHNKQIRHHRNEIRKLLRERRRTKRAALLSKISAPHAQTAENVELTKFLSEDGPTDAEKRQVIFIFGATNALLQVARGWYAAIRRSGISFGPRAYNDKYFFDQVPRTAQASSSNVPVETILGSHLLTINFLHQLLITNFNHMITTDTNRHLTRLPSHISFMLSVILNKYILRVRNGVVNLAVRLPVPIPNKDTQFYVQNVYVEPTSWMTDSANLALLNQLFAMQQHKAYPFHTVDVPADTLKGLIVHDEHGSAVPTDLHINEIVSVYGYATKNRPQQTETGPSGEGKYYYDLSGLQQNVITNILRLCFFPTFAGDRGVSGEDFNIQKYLPDEYNEKKLDNYFFDNDAYTVYFGSTAKISTANFCFSADLPAFNSPGDFSTTQMFDSNAFKTSSVTNQGLTYLTTKYDSNATMPGVYGSTRRDVPVFPDVTIQPAAYNLALQLAQVLQSPYQLFAQRPAFATLADYTYSQCLYDTYSKFFHPVNEVSMDYGVFAMQYNNRFTLPTPIAENCKAINSYNTWSYKDSSQSVTVQMHLQCVAYNLFDRHTMASKDISNGVFFHIQAGSDLPENWTVYNMLTPEGLGYWQAYGGTIYRPYNFERILGASDAYLAELRPYVKLCNVPERELPLPSMHVMYRANLPGFISPGVEDTKLRAVSIYTPLDEKSFADKSMEIFIKYTYMPLIEIPLGCNIPLLNIANVTSGFEDQTFFNLYQMSFVASYDGPSSEMDMYYSELRKKMIGSWSDLIPMLGNIASSLVGSAGGGGASDIMHSIMGMMGGGGSPLNKIFDLMAHPAVQEAAPQMGMLGDILSMFGTPIRNMTNYDQNGFVSTNITPPAPTEKPKKKSFWSTLGDVAMTAAPLLLSLL